MKIGSYIDFKYEKPASNENQENDNSKFDISKETDESNMPDEKKTIQSNNQHLNEAISLPETSKDERDSVFLDINIPDIVNNDEQPNISDIVSNDEQRSTPTVKKNSLIIDSSPKIKRRSKNLEKSNQHADDISKKKSKTFSLDEIKSNNENLIDKNERRSIIDRDIKSPYSRSPSLFDDSLNLDTQICDLLEQNVMDIAHLSELDSKMFASDLGLKKSPSPNVNTQLRAKGDTKNVNIDNNKLVQNRDSVLSWGDDSWNNSERLLKQIVQADSDQSNKKEMSVAKIKNIADTNISVTPESIKICGSNDKTSLRKTDVKKRIALFEEKESWKPKLPKIMKVESPITNIIINERKMSVESNKSDSDDIIVDSQQIGSPLCDGKNRTRTKLEKIRKLRSQKIEEISKINRVG